MDYKILESDRVNDALLLRLPANLTSDILLRLPIESISCCKCVCRTLEKILRDPPFAELHLLNASEADKRLIIQNKNSASSTLLFHVLDLGNISDISPKSSNHHDCAPRLFRKMVIPPIMSESEPVRVSVVGSCNGLLCLAYSIEKTQIFYLCNPILGEFMLLPEPMSGAVVRAFGFCPRTKQYKVVRSRIHVVRRKEDEVNYITFHSYCEIHTLGTNGWRTIANVNPPQVQSSHTHLNGNLHWLANGVEFSIVLYSFNLETEQVFDLPSPPQFSERHLQKRLKSFNVGVLGGLLCISYVLDRAQFETFVMKNYGVKDSWTKQFAIDINFISVLQARSGEVSWLKFMKIGNLRQVKFLDNGDLLLEYCDFPLIYYNPRKGRFWKTMELDDKGRDARSFAGTYDGCYYFPSLISLKGIAKSGNFQVVSQGVAATSSLTTKFIDLVSANV